MPLAIQFNNLSAGGSASAMSPSPAQSSNKFASMLNRQGEAAPAGKATPKPRELTPQREQPIEKVPPKDEAKSSRQDREVKVGASKSESLNGRGKAKRHRDGDVIDESSVEDISAEEAEVEGPVEATTDADAITKAAGENADAEVGEDSEEAKTGESPISDEASAMLASLGATAQSRVRIEQPEELAGEVDASDATIGAVTIGAGRQQMIGEGGNATDNSTTIAAVADVNATAEQMLNVSEAASTGDRSDDDDAAPQGDDVDANAVAVALKKVGEELASGDQSIKPPIKHETVKARHPHDVAIDSAVSSLQSIDADLEGEEAVGEVAADAKSVTSMEKAEAAAAGASTRRHSDPAVSTPSATEANETEMPLPIPTSNHANGPQVNVPAPVKALAMPMTPQGQFAEDNHANIVQSIKTTILPTGGTMKMRLDPPELGALQVRLHMRDGVMTAEFETSNDQATQLLSHSLSQLKNSLQQQGVTVDRIQVQQVPKDHSSQNNTQDDRSSSQQRFSANDQGEARREEQRKEALQRMWARMAMGEDPLDMVA